MALRLAQPLRFRLTRALHAGGASDAKPRWTLPEKDYHKFTYQPSIPDKHFNIGHWNYAPITMWLRARRPAMERVLVDVWATLRSSASSVLRPIQSSADKNLPGFGYKVVGFIGLLIGYNFSVMYVTSLTESWMFLEKLVCTLSETTSRKKAFSCRIARRRSPVSTNTSTRLSASTLCGRMHWRTQHNRARSTSFASTWQSTKAIYLSPKSPSPSRGVSV